MANSDLDWGVIATCVAPRTDRVRFADVSGQFKKIAWDMYKPLSGEETLWELREEDGEKFLYAVYGDESELKVTAGLNATEPVRAAWTAFSDREGRNITLSFKNVPIKRFAATEFGFTPDEAEEFAAFLTVQAADKDFVSRLLGTLPEAKKVAVAQLINQRGA